MSQAAVAQRHVLGLAAGWLRRAAFVAVLALAPFLAVPRGDVFDFPAVAHSSALWPFAGLVLLVLVDLRTPWRLAHLDLLALLAPVAALSLAGAQHPWFPFLVAAPLAYLAARMLAAARAPVAAAPRLQAQLPSSWLLGGIVVLVAVHVAWAASPGVPTDVGLDSVRGALAIIHGRALYAGPATASTYGPAGFEGYLPFAALLGAASAARATTVLFTLLAAVALFELGRRLRRDATVGAALALCWLALPFTLYEDALGWNDSLVAAALVATLLALSSPVRRGAMAALAAWTKLSPLALVPLLAVRRGGVRPLAAFVAAFAAATLVVFLPALAHGTLAAFVSHSFGYQASRAPGNSIWASLEGPYASSAPWLGTLARAAHGVAIVAVATLALLMPRLRLREDAAAVAAASAAVLALVVLCLSYFAFSYLLWFAPLALVGLLAVPA